MSQDIRRAIVPANLEVTVVRGKPPVEDFSDFSKKGINCIQDIIASCKVTSSERLPLTEKSLPVILTSEKQDRGVYMTILKFKYFEDADRFESEGRGVNWHFKPDNAYLNKALIFQVKVPFAHGVYKFKTFEEAETWEIGFWVKNGTEKRIS